MKYQQLTYEERVMLSTLKPQGLSIRTIAQVLGCHYSTLYRELDRNRCYKIDGAYRPSKAQKRTRARRSRSRRKLIPTMMEIFGRDRFVWASDFPHSDHTRYYIWEDRSWLVQFPVDARRKLLGDNISYVYRF